VQSVEPNGKASSGQGCSLSASIAGEDGGAGRRGSSAKNPVAWWTAFSSRETWRLRWAHAVGGSVRGSARKAEAAANLGEWDVVRLAAGFSGEPVLGGGGVLGVFERLRGRGALQGAQAKELGQGDDDGGLAAEVDDLVGA
jgi:hypothetical protein